MPDWERKDEFTGSGCCTLQIKQAFGLQTDLIAVIFA